MFRKKTKKDKDGNIIVDFELTQGDTAIIFATPKQESGELIDLSSISQCMFKLGNDAYNEVFTKEFDKQEENLMVRLESEETTTIPVGDYVYEVEYTFVDGTVDTPNIGTFTITDQIRK